MLYLRLTRELTDDDDLALEAHELKSLALSAALRDGYRVVSDPEESYEHGRLTVRVGVE